MKTLFLNSTQHSLTEEQVNRALELAEDIEIKDLKELNPELFEELRNTPSSYTQLSLLVDDYLIFLLKLLEDYDKIYLHLPIGSPAFMFLLSQSMITDLHTWAVDSIIPVFSHTERMVVEEPQSDGSVVKKSIFKFVDYILL